MDKVIQVFHSFAEAERADEEHYAKLSPQERVDLLLDLVARYREPYGEAGERLERVHRVAQLSRS